MLLLYNLFIAFSRIGIGIAAGWNSKARLWVAGRKKFFSNLQASIPANEKIIWMHCASAGELEQGKPVLEKLKEDYPNHKVLVTFFSPSGYSVGKKYVGADHIFYLPLDTQKNAKRFVQIVQPKLVIFVKYEYWYHHLKAVADQKIPLLLISSIFRKRQVFFKWCGGFYRNILKLFTKIFVQDKDSKELLHSIGIKHCSVNGDTRFDRVATIAGNADPIENISNFIKSSKVIIAGSTWPDDEQLLTYLNSINDYKLIIAPHEINPTHLKNISKLFPASVLYSKLNDHTKSKVLVIDNIGMLSRIYQYATITYIGGGFNKSGIHNTLEATVWSKPVIFGPNYQKFKEAKELIEEGAAFSVENETELKEVVQKLLTDIERLKQSSVAAGLYVQKNRGATEKIISYIHENRLLTTP